MAFATVEATATSSDSGSETAHTVSLPAGISSGDLLVAIFSAARVNNNGVLWPPGWNGFYPGYHTSGSDNNYLSVGWRIADGSEGSTVTVRTTSASRSAHMSYRITGHDSATPLSPASAGPDGYDLTASGPESFAAAINAAHRQASGSSEDPGAFDLNSSHTWIAATVSVPPASAGTHPSVVGQAISTELTTATSHPVGLPSSISSGDLLIGCFLRQGTTDDISWPAGWTEFFNDASSGNRLSMAYRQADGNEGSSVSVSTGSGARSTHTSYRITDHEDPSTEAPEATSATGTSATADPPSHSPTGGDQDYLWIAISGVDDAGGRARHPDVVEGASGDPDPPSMSPSGGADDYLWLPVAVVRDSDTAAAAPTNYTDLLTSAQFRNGLASARRELNASSEDPGVFDYGSTGQVDTWVSGTVAVNPSSSTGGGGGLSIPIAAHHYRQQG